MNWAKLATVELWCHHLPPYCVDRGLVDRAPAGKTGKSKNHFELSLCFITSNMLVASSVQVQGSSLKSSVDIVL